MDNARNVKAGLNAIQFDSPSTHRAEMRVTVLREIPEDAELSRNWNRLVGRMEHPEVFFTYQWALAASRAFRSMLSPLLLLMHEADELCGVAALAVPPHGQPFASFLSSSTADYCDIVSAPETRASVLACLLQEISDLELRGLTLANLPSESSTLKVLPTIARAVRFHLTSRPAYECGLVELGSEDQRHQMLHTVTHKSREQRGLKKLAKIGPLHLSHVVKLHEAEDCLRQVVSAQVSRFLATDRISPLLRPERRLFLREITSLLASEEWLKISELKVNGQAVAWNYGFHFGDSWFWYLPSFKVGYEDCSPGSCLLRLLVEEGCADPSLRWLDLGLGDESYKNRFATTVRKTSHVQLSSSLPDHVRIIGRQLVTTEAMRFPQAGDRLRRVKQLMHSLSHRLRDKGVSATLAHLGRRAARIGISRDEILLFEGPATEAAKQSDLCLNPLTWENLAEAAIQNADDSDTIQYLLRAAARLKTGGTAGLVLHDQLGNAVHFLAVTSCDGFHVAEIDYTLELADDSRAMIFDCWTPARYRGLGYYSLAIRLAASNVQTSGKNAFIFCAATNTPSIRGILKAGFTYRFSLVRRRNLGVSKVVQRSQTDSIASSMARSAPASG